MGSYSSICIVCGYITYTQKKENRIKLHRCFYCIILSCVRFYEQYNVYLGQEIYRLTTPLSVMSILWALSIFLHVSASSGANSWILLQVKFIPVRFASSPVGKGCVLDNTSPGTYVNREIKRVHERFIDIWLLQKV